MVSWSSLPTALPCTSRPVAGQYRPHETTATGDMPLSSTTADWLAGGSCGLVSMVAAPMRWMCWPRHQHHHATPLDDVQLADMPLDQDQPTVLQLSHCYSTASKTNKPLTSALMKHARCSSSSGATRKGPGRVDMTKLKSRRRAAAKITDIQNRNRNPIDLFLGPCTLDPSAGRCHSPGHPLNYKEPWTSPPFPSIPPLISTSLPSSASQILCAGSAGARSKSPPAQPSPMTQSSTSPSPGTAPHYAASSPSLPRKPTSLASAAVSRQPTMTFTPNPARISSRTPSSFQFRLTATRTSPLLTRPPPSTRPSSSQSPAPSTPVMPGPFASMPTAGTSSPPAHHAPRPRARWLRWPQLGLAPWPPSTGTLCRLSRPLRATGGLSCQGCYLIPSARSSRKRSAFDIPQA